MSRNTKVAKSGPKLDGGGGSCSLLEGTRAYSVARDCREALLAFVNQEIPWGKRELATWLSGHYAQVTRHAMRVDNEPRASGVAPSPISVQLAAENIGALLAGARRDVVHTLELAAVPDAAMSFARVAVATGTVARCRDAWGNQGWVPVDALRMLLSDRVLSLAAADYLMRPADYLALLSVCKRCRVLSFDAKARARRACAGHASSKAARIK